VLKNITFTPCKEGANREELNLHLKLIPKPQIQFFGQEGGGTHLLPVKAGVNMNLSEILLSLKRD